MKPRFDDRIKRPAPYYTAEASREPGYLARRFEEIRSRPAAPQQKRKGRNA